MFKNILSISLLTLFLLGCGHNAVEQDNNEVTQDVFSPIETDENVSPKYNSDGLEILTAPRFSELEIKESVDTKKNFDIKPIIIDGVKAKNNPIISVNNKFFLKEVLGEGHLIHYLSQRTLNSPKLKGLPFESEYTVKKASHLLQSVHNSFMAHKPIMLSPEVIWYAIMHEIAICVKMNSEQYAHYFTQDMSKKKEIHVNVANVGYANKNNDWNEAVETFKKPLLELVSKEARDSFLPKFSSMSKEDEIAILVSFMDSASEFYEFHSHSMCGIPEFQLDGKAEDWDLLVQHARKLSVMFPTLKDYFKDLMPVLDNIRKSAHGIEVDENFWCSIYKFESHSGMVKITGWISALYAYEPIEEGAGFALKKSFDWKNLENIKGGMNSGMFPSHVSVVPYFWHLANGKIVNMQFIGGVLGVQYVNGKYISPKLCFGIIEPKK